MRIAMITATPASVAEGSGTFVAAVGLAQGLEALGHDVVFARPNRGPGSLGFTVHRFRFNLGLDPAAVSGADWVIGWDMDGYRLAGHPGVRFAAYIHGQLADEARFERGAVAFAMRLQSRAERISVRRAARVLTVSRYSRRRLSELYGRPQGDIEIVPPAFDVERWTLALHESAAQPDVTHPTILCVCRMYPRKDVATLLRATARIRRDLPSVRLVLVGDGPERDRWIRLAAALGLGDCVRFRGQVDFDTLVESYAACHVFCLPSLQEGFGIVFLEAMTAAKPIVACAGTAAAELLQDGTHGILVPPADPDTLASALLRLLTNTDLRVRLGEAGPPTAAAYNASSAAKKLIAALASHPTRGAA